MDLKMFVKKKIEYCVSGWIAHEEEASMSLSFQSPSDGISVISSLKNNPYRLLTASHKFAS